VWPEDFADREAFHYGIIAIKVRLCADE